MIAAKVELSARDKIRLNKHLRDMNIKKKTEEQTKSVSPLRQRQQQVIDKNNNLKRKGMIGELEKLFLKENEGEEEEEDSPVDEEAQEEEEGSLV